MEKLGVVSLQWHRLAIHKLNFIFDFQTVIAGLVTAD